MAIISSEQHLRGQSKKKKKKKKKKRERNGQHHHLSQKFQVIFATILTTIGDIQNSYLSILKEKQAIFTYFRKLRNETILSSKNKRIIPTEMKRYELLSLHAHKILDDTSTSKVTIHSSAGDSGRILLICILQ